MKLQFKIFTFGLSLLMFNACNSDEDDNANSPNPINTSINKIMPLGASRIEGARPDYESYRYNLWKELIENNWAFDFVGTQTDNAAYPPFNGAEFDTDHEGRSGWTSGQILEGLEEWLSETASVDIVLLSSPGGNDALEGLPYSEAVSNINAIVDILQSYNPNITIIIEQLAPGRSDIMTIELTEFYEQMQQDVLTISENQTTTISKVIGVDMFTDFNDGFLADDVHYNEAGAEFIANRYYNVLLSVME